MMKPKSCSSSSSSSWCIREASRRRSARDRSRTVAFHKNPSNLHSTPSECSAAAASGDDQQQVRTSVASDASDADGRARTAAACAQRADGNHARTEATTKVSPRRRRHRFAGPNVVEPLGHHSLLEWPPERSWHERAANSRELIILPPERAKVRDDTTGRESRTQVPVGHAHGAMRDRLLPAAAAAADSVNASQRDEDNDERETTSSGSVGHLSLAASDKSEPNEHCLLVLSSAGRRERKRVIRRAANFVALDDDDENNGDQQNYGCQADTRRHARAPRRRHIGGLDLTAGHTDPGHARDHEPPEKARSSGFVISIISEQVHARTQKSGDDGGNLVVRARDVINRAQLNDGALGQRRTRTTTTTRTSGRQLAAGRGTWQTNGFARSARLGATCWLSFYALLALNNLVFGPQHERTPHETISQPPSTLSGHSNLFAFNLVFIKSVHCATSPPPNDSGQSAKFAFWLELERSLFEGSGAPTEAVAQLARQLADWPDQRQAALFYLEQVAGGGTGPCRGNAPPSTISLAQLVQPADHWSTKSGSPAQRVALDDLGASGPAGSELNEYLSGGSAASSRLAQLAVDNANLIGRLLAMGARRANDDDDQDDDQRNSGTDLTRDETARATETPGNFLGNLFRFKRQTTATNAADELGRLEMALRRLVTPKFMRYLLEFKAREWLTTATASDGPLLHSLGMVMFSGGGGDGDEDERHNSSEGHTSPKVWFGSRAVVGRGRGGRSKLGMVRNLYAHELNSSNNNNNDNNHLPSYLAKWWLGTTRSSGVVESIRSDLVRQDGSWFSPQLECGRLGAQPDQARWLLTYSIPIYSHSPPEGRAASLRGVSFVSLDLARMGPLISQCTTPSASAEMNEPNRGRPPNQKTIPSFLAGTHHCRRIKSSQCVPLPEYFTQQQQQQDQSDDDPMGQLAQPLRPGAYVCKCPSSWPQVAQEERESTRAHREQLIELLDSRVALNSSLYALDQLAIERVTASLQWQQDGGNGIKQNNNNNRALRPLGQPQRGGGGGGGAPPTARSFELTNKAAIARLLLLTRATTTATAGHGDGPGQGAAAGRADNATTAGAARRASVGHFTLGAQLDAEAALDWFARSRGAGATAAGSTWPEEACQSCVGDRVASEVPPSAALACLRPVADSASAATSIAQGSGGGDLMSRWLRPLVLIVQLACLLLTLVLVACLARIRKSRIILLSGGWLMLATMLLGALLLYACVLVRYYAATSLTCLLEPWLRELGFSTFYGSLLIKLYRILTEFQTRKAHRVCLRDKDQVVYLLAIVFIVIGYMSAWTALMVDGFFVRHQSASASVFDSENLPNIPNLDMTNRRRSLAVRWADGDGRGGAEQTNAQETETRTRLESQFGQQQWLPVPGGGGGDHLADLAAGDFVTREGRGSSGRLGGGTGDENKATMMEQIASSAETTTRRSMRRRDTAENLLNEHLEILERGLNSFGELFLGLLESEPKFEPQSDTFVYLIRCRKLAWDYVTESSEIALLLFGVHLIYKLRNASSEVHKEKLILSLAIFIELTLSCCVYLARHALWHSLTSDHLLLMYFARCQLTVSLTVVLVFAPKLRQVCRNKPGLLFGPSKFSALLRGGGGGGGSNGGDHPTGTSSGCHAPDSSERNSGGASSSSRTSSVRHRCHISCELHDHHLNDASRLQQAMLSNLSTLEIGTINLADMDPNEIQAELKRVYTQLELLKTKVMRRDNPHISKRRGGRKPGHRKFSLQAFHHGRHSSGSGGEHHSSMDRSGGGGVDSPHEPSSGGPAQRPAPANTRTVRLPALTELEGESPSSHCLAAAAGEAPNSQCAPTTVVGNSKPLTGPATKHVRVDESLNSQQDQESSSYAPAELPTPIKQLKKYRQLLFSSSASGRANKANSNSSARTRSAVARGSSSSSGGGGQNGGSASVQSNQMSAGGGGKSCKQNKWAPEMPSTSSLGGYLDDDVLMMTMNDSQSSGELTPQHRSSLVYSQSSFQQPHHQHLSSQPSASTSTQDHLD